jgi:hypothetical protein
VPPLKSGKKMSFQPPCGGDAKARTPPMIPEGADGRRLYRSDTKFKDDGRAPPPLRVPSQRLVLLNLMHLRQSPSCQSPGFRIIGFFPDEAALNRHIEDNFPNAHNDSSLWMTPVHQFLPICVGAQEQRSAEYVQRLLRGLRTLHEGEAKRRSDEFESQMSKSAAIHKKEMASVAEPTALEDPAERFRNTLFARRQQIKQSRPPLVTETTAPEEKSMAPLTLNQRIAGQDFAVICVWSDLRDEIVADPSLPQEPAVSFLQAFSDKADAERYAALTARPRYPGCDFDIVDVGMPLFPENVEEDSIPEKYGDETLDDLMRGTRENARNVSAFKEWCEKHGHKPDERSQ